MCFRANVDYEIRARSYRAGRIHYGVCHIYNAPPCVTKHTVSLENLVQNAKRKVHRHLLVRCRVHLHSQFTVKLITWN